MVGLARAQDREALHRQHGPGDHELGRALAAAPVAQGRQGRVLLLGHQDELLALARVRQADHGVQAVGPEAAGQGLDGGEGDHLAGDLGEALGPAEDPDVALGVDVDDVAGVVPALRRRLELPRLLGPEVAEHDVGAGDREPLPFRDAGDRLQPSFHAGQQAADRAGAVVHRRVDRQDRGAFGRAVALEDALAELLDPGPAGLLAQLLRTGEDVAQGVEVVGVRDPGIAGEEGVGAEEDGRVDGVGDLRDDAVVQRRGIEEGPGAGEKRQQQPAGQPEGVEDRQGVEDHVGRVEVDPRRELVAVGQDVGVAEHHALGRALGAGGEEHHRRVPGIAARAVPAEAQQGPAPEAEQLVAQAQALAQVLQVDQLDLFGEGGRDLFQARHLDEAPRGVDGPDLGRPAGGQQVGRAGGEVEHGRDPAEGLQPEEGDRDRGGVGQQDAGGAALRHLARHAGAEHQAAEQQLVVVQRLAVDVLQHLGPAALDGARLEQRLEEAGGLAVLGLEDHLRHDVVELPADDLAAAPALELRRHLEAARRQHGDGDLGEEPPAQLALEAGEMAVLGALDPHRDHGRAGLVGDHARAVVDLHQRAGHGQAAFRKDHAVLALGDLADQRLGRERPGRVHGEGLDQLHEGPHPPALRHVGVDGEERPAGQQRGQQRAVQEGGVVDHDHRGVAGGLEVLQPADLDPVEQPEDRADQALDHVVRQQPAGLDRDQHVGQGDHQEDLGDAEAELQQQVADARGRDHEERVDHVVAGDGPGPFLRLGLALQDRVERHDEEAGGGGEQQQVDQDPPGAGRGQVAGQRQLGAEGREARAGEVEVEREDRHAERAEGHAAGGDLALQQALAEDRAERDADGEDGQEQGQDVLVAAQLGLHVARRLRQEDEADQPEPGDAEDREEDGLLLGGVAQQPYRLAEDVVVDLEPGRRRRNPGDRQAGQPAGRGDAQDQADHQVAAVAAQDGLGADDHAEEDGQGGAGLDHRVAGDQFLALQVVGQDAVLQGPEEGRLQAHEEEHGEQELRAFGREAIGRQAHDADLEQLHRPDQARLVELVRELPGGGREEEEGQDEEAAGQGDQELALLRVLHQAEGDQGDQRGPEEVVVEGAQELGDEERQEAPATQDVIGRLRHLGPPLWIRSRRSSRPAAAGRRRGSRGSRRWHRRPRR